MAAIDAAVAGRQAEALNHRLRSAASEGDPNLLAALLSEGADVNTADQTGTTCVMRAVLNCDVACLAVLLSQQPHVDLERVNQLGRTALHIAS